MAESGNLEIWELGNLTIRFPNYQISRFPNFQICCYSPSAFDAAASTRGTRNGLVR